MDGLAGMSRRIVFTGPFGTQILQEQIVKALAKAMGANLLFLDTADDILSILASTVTYSYLINILLIPRPTYRHLELRLFVTFIIIVEITVTLGRPSALWSNSRPRPAIASLKFPCNKTQQLILFYTSSLKNTLINRRSRVNGG